MSLRNTEIAMVVKLDNAAACDSMRYMLYRVWQWPAVMKYSMKYIYGHRDGTLRAYPNTITNSVAEEPIVADTLSDVADTVCSHNSTRLCSCNVGITG